MSTTTKSTSCTRSIRPGAATISTSRPGQLSRRKSRTLPIRNSCRTCSARTRLRPITATIRRWTRVSPRSSPAQPIASAIPSCRTTQSVSTSKARSTARRWSSRIRSLCRRRISPPTAAPTDSCAISDPTRRRRWTRASSTACATSCSTPRTGKTWRRSISNAATISASARSTRRAWRSALSRIPASSRSRATQERCRRSRRLMAASITSTCGPAASLRTISRGHGGTNVRSHHCYAVREPARRRPAVVSESGF